MTNLLPENTLSFSPPVGSVPATLLAFQDDSLLVELRPPGDAPTSLWLVDLSSMLSHARPPLARELSYWHVPFAWLRALVEADICWVGRPQGMASASVPPPALLLQQHEFCRAFGQVLHEGIGVSVLEQLHQRHNWITGWTRGGCLVLAEAFCFWITQSRPTEPLPEIQARLRILTRPPRDPYHVVASITCAGEEILVDADGIWTLPDLLRRHTHDCAPFLLEAHTELLKEIFRDPARSRDLADQFARALGAFPLHLFLPRKDVAILSCAS